MPVPTPIPTPHRKSPFRWASLRFVAIALGFLLLGPCFLLPPALARGTDPQLRIPLENLGFQPLPPQFLLNGSSLFTLHYVDDKHLLLTFVAHRLIPRLPNEPADDQDRMVDAVLLELPSGKILARTSWHLHAHAQYLWNLGHGHFLLRVRDTLTTFAPLANLSTGKSFAQHPFIVSAERHLAAIIISADSDLLIIESVKRKPPEERPKTPLFDPSEPKLTERDPVQINFYRIHSDNDGGPVTPTYAGAVVSQHTGDVPATTAGYLAVVDQGHQHWAFDFHSYSGKVAELSPFDSSCSPAPLFVSHSEFIAFGCRGGQTMQQIGGFNMRGEEMWEQGLFGSFIAPSIAYAPAGGRFALSRIMIRNSSVPDQLISNDEVSSQTVVVYQTGTGKQLLRADCSPIERAGQNFALSPTGTALAVVHADAIEIYNLPPLTTKDESDLKLAQSSAPAENNLPIHFTTKTLSSTGADPDATDPQSSTQPSNQSSAQSNSQPAATPANAGPDSTQPAPSTQPATQTQDAATPSPAPATPPAAQTPPSQTPADPSTDQQQHRLPPTIYTLPTDKAPTPAHPDAPQ